MKITLLIFLALALIGCSDESQVNKVASKDSPKIDTASVIYPEGVQDRYCYLKINEWYVQYSEMSGLKIDEPNKTVSIFMNYSQSVDRPNIFKVNCAKMTSEQIEKMAEELMFMIDDSHSSGK